jgi:hypothetical protein
MRASHLEFFDVEHFFYLGVAESGAFVSLGVPVIVVLVSVLVGVTEVELSLAFLA